MTQQEERFRRDTPEDTPVKKGIASNHRRNVGEERICEYDGRPGVVNVPTGADGSAERNAETGRPDQKSYGG